MINVEFYLSKVDPPLFGRRGGRDDPVFVFGVPFDSGSTGTPGQRLAPRRIREASLSLETFSPELGVEVEELGFFDAGDVPFATEYSEMHRIVSSVVAELREAGKTLVVIGGDHSVTAPVVSELAKEGGLLLLVADAHLDLRDEYPLNARFSHATAMKRVLDSSENVSLLYYKPRAFSKEEYAFLSGSDRARIARELSEVKETLSDFNRVYISVDMDSIDPAYAPGTGTPEPLGLSPVEVMQLISLASKEADVVGLDVVEVNPLVDCNNITSLLAAKLIMQFLFNVLASR